MIALDVNVVLAAHRDDHPHHQPARALLDDLVAGDESFGIPTGVWHSFLRLATSSLIFDVPTPAPYALDFLDAVIAQPNHLRCEPGRDHNSILRELIVTFDAVGNLMPDAVLAAIAIENAATLASFDRDFARFDDLTWFIPGR